MAQASVLLAIAQVKERAAFAFLSKRMSPSTATRLSKKGREIRLGNLSPQMRKPWESSDVDEWRKWVLHEAVYLPEQAELDTLQEGDAIPMRIVRTDKNEATRGELDLEAHPIKAKSRIVSQGFKDKQALTGKIDTDAPTLSNEGTGLIYQTAASEQWRLEQGDVDSAFISGGYLDPSRRLHFIVPKGGLPALPDLGWPALPEGTILGARKGSYGMKDAPLLWFLTHTGAMTDLGMIRSRLNKAFFLHYAADGSLDGMIGVHVDDDLITGTDHFFDTVVKELRKRFNYGKWHQANRPGESFVHCGRRVTRGEDGSVHLDMQSYVESVLPIKLDSTRKAKTEAKVTHEERSSLWSKVPQLAWLVRGVNPYISFRVATLQQRLHDVDLTVEAVKEFNSTLADAKRRMPTHVFHPIPLRDAVVIAVGDASLGNVGKTKTRSQGGCVTLIGEARMAEEGAEGRVSVVHWRSHRIKRVVRSTIASECFAAIEAVEEADIWRAHLAEAFHFHGKLDLKQWEAEVNSCVPLVHVTDARSLFDLVRKRGTVPTERRLLLDIESLRERVESGMICRWCDTKQMVADCLTKHDDRCGDYLRYVIAQGRFSLTKIDNIEKLLGRVRNDQWKQRKAFYDAKYPNRSRVSSGAMPTVSGLTEVEDGWSSAPANVSLLLSSNSTCLKIPPSELKQFRMSIALNAEDDTWHLIEAPLSWPSLCHRSRRGRLPWRAKRLATVFAKDRSLLEKVRLQWSSELNEPSDEVALPQQALVVRTTADDNLKDDDAPKASGPEPPPEEPGEPLNIAAVALTVLTALSGTAAAVKCRPACACCATTVSVHSAVGEPTAAPAPEPEAVQPPEAIPEVVETGEASVPEAEAPPCPPCPPPCLHPRVTKAGSNQWRHRRTCLDCGNIESVQTEFSQAYYAAKARGQATSAAAKSKAAPKAASARRRSTDD